MNKQTMNWVGELYPEEELHSTNPGFKQCFVNQVDIMQFYIKIISKTPGSKVPNDMVCFYSDQIQQNYIRDNHSFDSDNRVEHFLDQIKNTYMSFHYEYNSKGFCIGSDIEFLPKFNTKTKNKCFVAIPTVICNNNEGKDSFDEIIKRVQEKEFVCPISNYETDTQEIPYVLLYNPDTCAYHVVGNFTSYTYCDEGIKFQFKELKELAFDETWYEDVLNFSSNQEVVFLSELVHEQILDQLTKTSTFPIPERKNTHPTMKEMVLEVATKECDDILAKEDRNELHVLQRFEEVVGANGLYYHKKDLINFHTAVKSGALVILSGLSGTGKSQLVRCYAQALGMENNEFTIIPVRPSWMDDSDFIGYVDAYHMCYRPSDTGFLQILIEASKEENKNKQYLICLDEMNLARVEHYFSPFLSLLEMPVAQRFLRLYADEYIGKLENEEQFPAKIPLGDNLRIIGTVNIDETTFHFSDKVLDRANVIRLSIVPYTDWKDTTEKTALSPREREFLWRAHERLQSVGGNLGIGPRVLTQIGTYLSNLPAPSSFGYIVRGEGLDLQIVQRVLTKVRGQREQLLPLLQPQGHDSLLALLGEYEDLSLFLKTRGLLETKCQEITKYGYTM